MRRIVIIGTGFAGMWAALAAKRLIVLNRDNKVDIEVTVVSLEPKLVLRPRLYESGARHMSVPLDDLFRETGIRSRLRCPAIPGLRAHSFSINTLEDILVFEEYLHSLASLPASPARNMVVVVGSSFTGIEITAELPSRLRVILGVSHMDADLRTIIIEQASEIGPELSLNPRPVILRALTAQGMELKLGTTISSIDKHGVVISTSERINSATVVWTAGVEVIPLTTQIPGEKDTLGRIHVDADLCVPSATDIFVAGDAALADTDGTGHHALMSCHY